jgi:hypothetical protein
VPGLYIRPDGRYLAVFGRHNHDRLTRWRICQPARRHGVAAEQTLLDDLVGDDYVTYANLRPAVGKRLYNFVRGIK